MLGNNTVQVAKGITNITKDVRKMLSYKMQ